VHEAARPITSMTIMKELSSVLEYANNKEFEAMHRVMSKGLTPAVMGAVMTGVQTGLLTKLPGGVKTDGKVLSLGLRGDKYLLHDSGSAAWKAAVEYVDRVIATARRANLAWPASQEGIPVFLQGLLTLLKECRHRGVDRVGLLGGATSTCTYIVKHGCRCFIVALAQSGLYDPWYGDMQMKAIKEWLPDEKKYVEAVQDWTCEAIEKTFSLNPAIFSCCLCLIGGLTEEERTQLMQAADKDLLKPVFAWEMTWREGVPKDGFSPTPKSLVEALNGAPAHTPSRRAC